MANGQSTKPEIVAVDVDTARAMIGNVSRQTMYNLLNSGVIQSKKVGRRRLVLVWSIKEWAAHTDGEQASSPASPPGA